MLLDYDFYIKDAIDEGVAFVISLDRLLLTRVFAMGVPKYMDDLNLMKNYYCKSYQNPDYIKYAEEHFSSYKNSGGIVWGGIYIKE